MAGALIAATAAIIGLLITNFLTVRRENRIKKLQLAIEHAEKQISEFYFLVTELIDELDAFATVTPSSENILELLKLIYKKLLLTYKKVVTILHSKIHLVERWNMLSSFTIFPQHYAGQKVEAALNEFGTNVAVVITHPLAAGRRHCFSAQMQRNELECLSRDEMIELVLRLQRPEKTSRTSSKPPSTDGKERREQAKPGGAKPGHEGHNRILGTDPDQVVDHAPQQCLCCCLALSPDLPSEAVNVHEQIELPKIKPIIEHHRRLAVQCPGCGARVVAASPPAATGTPFGPRLHAEATYLKTYQA